MSISVAVIIPTYNRCEVLVRAIQSIQNQTLAASEIIVVDDGSTDNTRETVQALGKMDSRISYYHQSNNGVSSARNLGIRHCNCDWIALLDSDDEWLPEKLKRQFELLRSEPTLKVIHGEEIWYRNGVRVNQKKKHQKFGGFIFEHCLPLCAMSPSSIVIHHSVFEDVGTFDEDFVVCEDYDLWLKITAKYPVGFISSPVIKKFGGHADQLSRKYFAMDYWRVKSLYNLLNQKDTTHEQRNAAIPILLKKAEILLKGYKKHENLENFEEVESMQNKFMTKAPQAPY